MSTPTSKIKHVSASQFKTYSLCKRKWYIEKCTDAPRPEPSAAMLLGSAVHELLEEYVSNGVAIDGDTKAGRIARPAIKYIPESTDLHVELSLRMESIDPPLVGFIDLYDTSDPSCPVVIDYKTTSAWKWARKEEQLRGDPQMIAYAQYALEQHPEANDVTVAHIQLKTKGAPEGRLVSIELTREHVAEQWAKLVELATEMKQTSYLDSVEEVPPTLSACGAFGGCPFADTCAALGPAKNPFAGIQNLKSETRNKEEKMSRLQELRDRKKRKILPPAPPTNGSPRPTGVLSSDAASRAVEAEPEVLTSSAALGRKGKALLELAVLESKQSNAEVLTETPAGSIAFTEPVPSKDNFSDELYDEAAKALLAHMRDRSVQRIGKVAAKTIVGKVLDLRRVRLYYVEKACHSSEGTLSPSSVSVPHAPGKLQSRDRRDLPFKGLCCSEEERGEERGEGQEEEGTCSRACRHRGGSCSGSDRGTHGVCGLSSSQGIAWRCVFRRSHRSSRSEGGREQQGGNASPYVIRGREESCGWPSAGQLP